MMTLKRLGYLRELFSGWSEKEINLTYQMLLFTKKAQIDLEEFEDFANTLQLERFNNKRADINLYKLQQIWARENAVVCPECGAPMNVADVNNKKCTMVGGKWRSVWTCANVRECGHQIWNKKPAAFEFKKWMKPFYDKWGNSSIAELTSKETEENIRLRFKAIQKRCGGSKE